MSVNEVELFDVTCDWRGCPMTLSNLDEWDLRDALTGGGWEVDGSIFNGVYTYCPDHAGLDGSQQH